MGRSAICRWCTVAAVAVPLLAGAFALAAPVAWRPLTTLEQSVMRGGQCTGNANQTCGQNGTCGDSIFVCATGPCGSQNVGGSCGNQVDGHSPDQCVASQGGECAKGQQIPCTDNVACQCGNIGTLEIPEYVCTTGAVTPASITYQCLSN